jgi:hypothetical protein
MRLIDDLRCVNTRERYLAGWLGKFFDLVRDVAAATHADRMPIGAIRL